MGISRKTNRNITSSFDTGSLVCKTCDLKPDHKILVSNKALDPNTQQDPVVFVLSDQSFPACFPAGGEGNCLKIIRLEDGSLSDLTAVFLETVANHTIPAGSVVLIHSLSYLSWVGPAAYVEDFVHARQRICVLYWYESGNLTTDTSGTVCLLMDTFKYCLWKAKQRKRLPNPITIIRECEFLI